MKRDDMMKMTAREAWGAAQWWRRWGGVAGGALLAGALAALVWY